MDWLARHGFDRRFPILLFGSAAITGFTSALVVLMAGIRNPADLAMAGAFLGIGTLLQVICPAVLLWLIADVLVRRTRFNRRWVSTFTAWVIAVLGWLIFVDLAQDTFGPRMWGGSAPMSGTTAVAIVGCTIMPALAAWLYRPTTHHEQAHYDLHR